MAALFSSFALRKVVFKNRIAVSPMSQYRARDGLANDWHLAHLGRFAMGGAALVYAEATAVTRDGRRTRGSTRLRSDNKGFAKYIESDTQEAFTRQTSARASIQIEPASTM
ncbi:MULTISPECIES: hypothetical protein [unclassified Ruegeria]|uniref:oxidoreductase n=1 Tax=unclassified Ruegeria TaxID=2625375 RepID=UPI001488129E|nr:MULTISPECIES: hypothetical protein [unclassified Ruegeria]